MGRGTVPAGGTAEVRKSTEHQENCKNVTLARVGRGLGRAGGDKARDGDAHLTGMCITSHAKDFGRYPQGSEESLGAVSREET